MNKKLRSSSILDVAGVIALAGAATALAGILWFPHVIAETLLFSAFHWCLALGLGTFFVNRLAEIARVIANTPDPKALRSANRAGDPAIAAPGTNNVTDGKFRRAA